MAKKRKSPAQLDAEARQKAAILWLRCQGLAKEAHKDADLALEALLGLGAKPGDCFRDADGRMVVLVDQGGSVLPLHVGARDMNQLVLPELRALARAYAAGDPGSEVAIHDFLVEQGYPFAAAWHFTTGGSRWYRCDKTCSLVRDILDGTVRWPDAEKRGEGLVEQYRLNAPSEHVIETLWAYCLPYQGPSYTQKVQGPT